jgi:hypothetical protein
VQQLFQALIGHRLAAFGAALAWWAGSFYLLTLPGGRLQGLSWADRLQADKWVHIGLFAGLVWLWCRAFFLQKAVKNRLPLAAFLAVLALAYGIAMEFVQKHCVAQRSFDGWDIVADGLGCALGFWMAHRGFKSQSPPAL